MTTDDRRDTGHRARRWAPRGSGASAGAAAKRSLKVLISLLWFGASAIRGLALGLAGREREPPFTVLYYHGIPEMGRTGFAEQMSTLARIFTVLPARYQGPLPRDRQYCVAITFDDAFRSVLDRGVPELLRHSLPATVFVPVGYVGQPPGWITTSASGRTEQVMSRDELRSLPQLVELGSHTVSHPHLRALDDQQLSAEIAASRRQLSDLCGADIALLAFPYGEYDQRAVRACREAGYERVYGIEPHPADPAGRDFVRGRIAVEPTDSKLVFGLKARGAYAWMPYASALMAKADWRRRHTR